MCGIAGILNFDGRPVEERDLTMLTDALAHRGRDCAAVRLGAHADGLSTYPGIGLGHRRLSIIDLSAESAQPMSYGGRALWITYNGELYNFELLRAELEGHGCVFRTKSDTEVVLAAYLTWGEDCLTRFNGIFALALWDEREQTLVCARDPLGVKPLYVERSPSSFRFASEAQALARGRRSALSHDALAGYLLSMYVPADASIFEGIQKLRPGSLLRVTRDGRMSERLYRGIPRFGFKRISATHAAERLRTEIDRAVTMQLRSDVPVGALLSGGFDSGMVVASAAARAPGLHTYSVGFDDGVQADELPIAKALAGRYGTTHHERVIRGEEVVPLLDRAIARMTEPVADSAIVPTYVLSAMAAADGVKVLLSGTGGDEVFAGYPRYVGTTPRRRLLLRMPDALRRAISMLVGDPATAARLRHRGLDMLITTGGSPALAQSAFDDGPGFGEFLERFTTRSLPASDGPIDPLHQHMRFDLQVYLPDLLLLLLDQLTMAHTVEGRVPLLDADLVAASYALPSSMHARPGETKRLMRRMATDRLDPRTLRAPKQGFSGPVAQWVSRNAGVFRDRTLAVREIPGLERIPVERLWTNDGRNRPRRMSELFSLFCLSTWYQTHVRACA